MNFHHVTAEATNHTHARSVGMGLVSALLLLVSNASAAEESQTPIVPKTDGRNVYALPGAIAVMPELVEPPTDDYKSVLGPKPFGVITIDGKQLGEIYFSPLKKSAADEAKEMARSAAPDSPVSLVEKGPKRLGGKDAEFVTLKIAAESKFGNPWIIHSVYLPRNDGSVTFKIVASEKEFERLKPLLYAAIDPIGEEKKEKK